MIFPYKSFPRSIPLCFQGEKKSGFDMTRPPGKLPAPKPKRRPGSRGPLPKATGDTEPPARKYKQLRGNSFGNRRGKRSGFQKGHAAFSPQGIPASSPIATPPPPAENKKKRRSTTDSIRTQPAKRLAVDTQKEARKVGVPLSLATHIFVTPSPSLSLPLPLPPSGPIHVILLLRMPLSILSALLALLAYDCALLIRKSSRVLACCSMQTTAFEERAAAAKDVMQSLLELQARPPKLRPKVSPLTGRDLKGATEDDHYRADMRAFRIKTQLVVANHLTHPLTTSREHAYDLCAEVHLAEYQALRAPRGSGVPTHDTMTRWLSKWDVRFRSTGCISSQVAPRSTLISDAQSRDIMQAWLIARLVPDPEVKKRAAVDVMRVQDFQDFINTRFKHQLALLKRPGRQPSTSESTTGISIHTARVWLIDLGYEVDKSHGVIYAGKRLRRCLLGLCFCKYAPCIYTLQALSPCCMLRLQMVMKRKRCRSTATGTLRA